MKVLRWHRAETYLENRVDEAAGAFARADPESEAPIDCAVSKRSASRVRYLVIVRGTIVRVELTR